MRRNASGATPGAKFTPGIEYADIKNVIALGRNIEPKHEMTYRTSFLEVEIIFRKHELLKFSIDFLETTRNCCHTIFAYI